MHTLDIDLLDAARRGDCHELLEALEKGANVNAVHTGNMAIYSSCRRGDTPLITAVLNERQECVAALIKHGADTNLRDIDGDTALSLSFGLTTTKMLINAGADPFVVNNDGCNVLHEVLYYARRSPISSIPLVKYLISFNIPIDVRDRRHQKTPAEIAYEVGGEIKGLMMAYSEKLAIIKQIDDFGDTAPSEIFQSINM